MEQVIQFQQWLQPHAGFTIELVKENPVHFAVEVILVVFISYILLVKRSYDPAKRGYGGRAVPELTKREEDALIAEWEPEPLVSAAEAAAAAEEVSPVPFIIDTFLDAPCRVTVTGVAPLSGPASSSLVASSDTSKVARNGNKTNGSALSSVSSFASNSEVKVNFTSQDFLGLGFHPAVRAAARTTVEEYTVGSCGPRGFYGTTLKHLSLEATIARFMDTPESITYSDATSTISSVIPAFAKRGDVLLVDEGVNIGIQLGARLSRSKVIYFRHNDTTDLKNKLLAVAEADKQQSGLALTQRRFIVVEGLYANTGRLADLDTIGSLATQFKWRIILDDSLGFGVLGSAGRGASDSTTTRSQRIPVEVIIGSLATTLASVGGFCVGSRQVVDHQRLSGAGYCFSASAPPFTCATAEAALKVMMEQPQLLVTLKARSISLHNKLGEALAGKLVLTSSEVAPIKLLSLADQAKRVAGSHGSTSSSLSSSSVSSFPAMRSPTTQEAPAKQDRATALSRRAEEDLLERIVRRACVQGGVLVSRTHSLDTEAFPQPPCLKVVITAAHSEADCDLVAAALAAAVVAELQIGVSSGL